MFCRCVADVQSGVDKLLNHVMSVKALSSIKTAIHSKLAASPVSEKSDHTPWAELWASTCQLVLKRELGLWDTFFQAPLLKRVKVGHLVHIVKKIYSASTFFGAEGNLQMKEHFVLFLKKNYSAHFWNLEKCPLLHGRFH